MTPPLSFARLVAIWNGDLGIDELDQLVTATYRGHIGSRSRDLAQLKLDIAAYRENAPGVRFTPEHQFGQGVYLATRLTAHAGGRTITGLNMSRWQDDLLAEEWAVWESFPDSV